MNATEEKIKAVLLETGFDLVGIASALPMAGEDLRLRSWIESGHAGEMEYMKRNAGSRHDPGFLLPGARSAVVAACAYAPPSGPPGPVAAYALYRDYHLVFREALARGVEVLDGAGARSRIAVDTAPLLERALARRAGLGWIGYSSNLITPEFGPFVQLGVILTSLELEPDGNETESSCEECGRCLEACPTGALREPYRLDARRCISYLTIEKKGPFTSGEAQSLNGWAFGCDLCTLSCRKAPGRTSRLLSRKLEDLDLERLLDRCESGFKKGFKETPLLRCGRSRLVRNILSAGMNLPWAAERAAAHLSGGTFASRDAARRAVKVSNG